MRILLEECVPRAVKRHFLQPEVQTVPEAGWAGKKNGELLRLCEGRFDAFLTVDQNLRFQQSLMKFRVAVVLLLLPAAEEALHSIRPGELCIIGE